MQIAEHILRSILEGCQRICVFNKPGGAGGLGHGGGESDADGGRTTFEKAAQDDVWGYGKGICRGCSGMEGGADSLS